MFLTKVELSGFKSFADKTSFEFDKGITAILGPNGCGKSNVVDAIKWVLGESRPKQLRGDAMLDVIFAGSEKRKAVGMAEVNLYFNNEDGTLPVEYNEVCVTRRLYRSGESEYLINRQTCRRRDIRELFMDTGVGTSAYSFIEQGRVEALLHAKPAERRAVFEEAAGISKYKARRKETLNRLDRTNQYLARVNDIVEEVEKNIRRVGRQAAGARRFQKLKGELDALKTHAYCRSYMKFHDRLDELANERKEIDDLLAQEGGRQATLAKTIAELTAKETELSEKIREFEQSTQVVQDELTSAQIELSRINERLSSLDREKADSGTRAEQLKTRIAAIESEETETASLLLEKKGAAESLDEELRAKGTEREALLASTGEAEREIEEARRKIDELSNRRSEIRQELIRAESEEQSLTDRMANLESRLQSIATEESSAQGVIGELESKLAEVAGRIAALNDEMNSHKQREEALRKEAAEFSDRLSTLRSEESAKSSRLSTLQDLERSLAGAFAGVKAIMTAKNRGERDAQGIVGLAAELMKVPTDIALAIETALGGHAQDIIVETARDAQDCIRYLKQNRAGRATFLPLDQIRPRRRLDRRVCGMRGVLGEAVDLIEFDHSHNAAMEYLLAGVLIVEDLTIARELACSEGRGILMVTLDGEVINPHGAMTGGEGNKKQAGIVTRRAEMQELEDDIAVIRNKMTDVEVARKDAIVSSETEIAKARECEKALSEIIPQGQEIQRELSVKKNEIERVSRDRNEIEQEKAKFTESIFGLAPRRESLAEEERLISAELETKITFVNENSARVGQSRDELNAINESYSTLREKRAESQSHVEEMERRLSTLERDKSERLRELSDIDGFTERAATERENLITRREELDELERDLVKKRDSSRDDSHALRQNIGEIRNQLNEEREGERAAQRRINQVMEAQNDIKLKESEVALKLEAVEEKARQELEIADLAAMSAKVRAELVSYEATINVQPESVGEEGESASDDNAPLGEAREFVSVDGEPIPNMTVEQLSLLIADISDKIAKIGPVNLLAIEEQAELEARAEFLKCEQEDLEQASNDLLAVIDRLNDECNRRFDETFETVRHNFQELFRKLFGGGKADLVIENTDGLEGIDKLDAGIDIIARPPGKEPKSISLLSGGEKALCAVAMLFAIFRSKPSPFCILDEVDGPLDESNIDRFMGAVREFSEETQFILISHAKRTMGMTDTIYGVTQDEPGISTKYSLRFTEMYDSEKSSEESHQEELVAVG